MFWHRILGRNVNRDVTPEISSAASGALPQLPCMPNDPLFRMIENDNRLVERVLLRAGQQEVRVLNYLQQRRSAALANPENPPSPFDAHR